MHKCALGRERLTKIIVSYHNMLISNQNYPKRRVNILNIVLEKGKFLRWASLGQFNQ